MPGNSISILNKYNKYKTLFIQIRKLLYQTKTVSLQLETSDAMPSEKRIQRHDYSDHIGLRHESYFSKARDFIRSAKGDAKRMAVVSAAALAIFAVPLAGCGGGGSTGVNNPPPVTYTLTESVKPASSGTASGAGTYDKGQNVTISEIPAAGYAFSGWVGTGTGSYTGSKSSATVTMNGNITETADFTANPTTYTLMEGANPSGAGTTTPGSGTYNKGQSVNISETPATGYVFSGWTGTGTGSYTGSNASSTITMNSNINETANYNTAQETLTISNNGCTSTTGAGTYNYGTTEQITAAVPSGDIFTGWTGTGTGSYSGTNNPASVTMNNAITEAATCQPPVNTSNAVYFSTINPNNTATVYVVSNDAVVAQTNVAAVEDIYASKATGNVYVSEAGGQYIGGVSVVDVVDKNLSQIAQVSLTPNQTTANYIGINTNGSKLFVTGLYSSTDDLSVINTSNNSIATQLSFPYDPTATFFDPNGNAWITNGFGVNSDAAVTVLTPTYQMTPINIPGVAAGNVAFDASNNTAYLGGRCSLSVCSGSYSIYPVDMTTYNVGTAITLPDINGNVAGPGTSNLIITADNSIVFASQVFLGSNSDVSLISTASNTIVDNVSEGQTPTYMRLLAGKWLGVINTQTNSSNQTQINFDVLDETGNRLVSIPIETGSPLLGFNKIRAAGTPGTTGAEIFLLGGIEPATSTQQATSTLYIINASNPDPASWSLKATLQFNGEPGGGMATFGSPISNTH